MERILKFFGSGFTGDEITLDVGKSEIDLLPLHVLATLSALDLLPKKCSPIFFTSQLSNQKTNLTSSGLPNAFIFSNSRKNPSPKNSRYETISPSPGSAIQAPLFPL